MFPSLTRLATTTVAESIQKLLPKQLPPSLVPRPGSLYTVLSRTPTGGVGSKVFQTRWHQKGISDCYWVVTRSRFKCDGKHGKVWGQLVWRGKNVSSKEELIRGGLKYTWKQGCS